MTVARPPLCVAGPLDPSKRTGEEHHLAGIRRIRSGALDDLMGQAGDRPGHVVGREK